MTTKAAIEGFISQQVLAVAGECVLMYQPHTALPHKVHKFFKETFGGKPE